MQNFLTKKSEAKIYEKFRTKNSEVMCNCVDVNFGTYGKDGGARTALVTPLGRERWIDNCLISELQSLWEMGIKTFGSCCGHNKQNGYIDVDNEAIPIMLELGYVSLVKSDGVGSHLFFPQSIPITNKR
jgi:hypothetical protein